MGIPDSVLIYGFRFAVVRTPKDVDDPTYGKMFFDERRIEIGDWLTPQEEADTLLHEIIHAIIQASGWVEMLSAEGVEEGIVRALEAGLAPLVRLRLPRKRSRAKKTQ